MPVQDRQEGTDAVFDGRTVLVDDMSTETRWSESSRRAAGHGARSMLSFQLHVDGTPSARSTLYGRRP